MVEKAVILQSFIRMIQSINKMKILVIERRKEMVLYIII